MGAFRARPHFPKIHLPKSSWTATFSGKRPVRRSVSCRGCRHEATITAHAADGDAQVLVWVQPPAERPSSFRITLVFSDDVDEAWRQELQAAAERWQRVIRAELPAAPIGPLVPGCSADGMPAPGLSGVEPGVRIWVSLSAFSETDYAEAVAAQCARRTDAATTTFGRIVINSRRTVLSASRLRYLALHEMGHTFGLVGLRPNQSWDVSYALPLALEGYRREFGRAVPFLSVSAGHWDLGHDVMGSLRLTIDQITIGALMDAGYPAAWYAADPS